MMGQLEATENTTMSELSRRSMLKRAGQATIGASALGVISGTAAADSFDGHYVNTRGYYNCNPDTWWQPHWWDYGYDLPTSVDDLTIVVHGIQNDFSQGIDKARTAGEYLDAYGYSGRVMAWTWRGDCGDCGWGCWDDFDKAYTTAKWDGRRLAEFIDWAWDYYSDPEIRLLSHSLGARVVIYALYYLTHEQGHSELADNLPVTSTHLLAGAEDNDEIRWRDSEIQSNTAAFYNYVNPEDDNLWLFETYYGEESLGREGGPDIGEPCNYFDRHGDAFNDHDFEDYLVEFIWQIFNDMVDAGYDRTAHC